MEVSTATTTNSTVTATTEKTSSTQQTSSKNETSFKDEMDKVSCEKNTENKEDVNIKNSNDFKTDEKSQDVVDKVSDTNNFLKKSNTDVIQNDFNNPLYAGININNVQMNNFEIESEDVNSTIFDANRELKNITLVAGCKKSIDYTSIQMSDDDAEFFTNLVQNTDKTLQHVASELQNLSEQTTQKIHQNVRVSATLLNALSESMKTNQPFRIDLGQDVSIIMQVNKDGTLSAKFIPGDAAVEQYLKQNIQALQRRFDEENLPYKELSYSSNQQQKRQNQNNKENNRE